MSTDPAPHDGPAAPDPSMDDILASIRRILDEEGQRAGAEDAEAVATPGATPGAPSRDDDGVLDLGQFKVEPAGDASPFPPPGLIDGPVPGPVPAPPPILAEPSPVTDMPPSPDPLPMPLMHAAGETNPPRDAAPYPLVAPAAAAASAASVGALLRTLASERTTQIHRGGPTIEDLVREEIRPLLKDWLDSHLPPLVERLVRAEIERVVSRMT